MLLLFCCSCCFVVAVLSFVCLQGQISQEVKGRGGGGGGGGGRGGGGGGGGVVVLDLHYTYIIIQ